MQAGKTAGIPLERIRAALDTLPADRAPTKRDWERLSHSWGAELDARIATLQGDPGPPHRLHRLRLPIAATLRRCSTPATRRPSAAPAPTTWSLREAGDVPDGVTPSDPPDDDERAARARAWRDRAHAAVCDVIEPWAHGTVVRATRYPSYYDLNVVRVEEDPAMDVDALVALSDEALAGLEHRRVDFDDADRAEPLRAGFEARGWKAVRLVWMRHETPAPSGPASGSAPRPATSTA